VNSVPKVEQLPVGRDRIQSESIRRNAFLFHSPTDPNCESPPEMVPPLTPVRTGVGKTTVAASRLLQCRYHSLKRFRSSWVRSDPLSGIGRDSGEMLRSTTGFRFAALGNVCGRNYDTPHSYRDRDMETVEPVWTKTRLPGASVVSGLRARIMRLMERQRGGGSLSDVAHHSGGVGADGETRTLMGFPAAPSR
jgi:hypothetical protein